MTDNAANRKEVREKEKAARLWEHNRQNTIKNWMDDQNGRRMMWELLEDAHVFATIPPTDPVTMSYAEGERNAGLKLLALVLAACPNEFIQAMREANDRNNNRPVGEYPRGEDSDWGNQGRDDAPNPDDANGNTYTYTHPDADPDVQRLIKAGREAAGDPSH